MNHCGSLPLASKTGCCCLLLIRFSGRDTSAKLLAELQAQLDPTQLLAAVEEASQQAISQLEAATQEAVASIQAAGEQAQDSIQQTLSEARESLETSSQESREALSEQARHGVDASSLLGSARPPRADRGSGTSGRG